jgi:hypothetical protein
MNVPSDAPRRYRIVFRGECGHVFADVFSNVTIESGHGYTCLVTAVRDQSEFYGLLDRFQDLALLPVSINELGPGGPSVTGLGGGTVAGLPPAAW